MAVVCVNNGHEAYRTARSIRPDLVIADYRLAQMGGLELCTKLRHDRLTFEIPVVMLTASGFGTPATNGLSNVKRVLTKPVKANGVLALVRSLMATSRVPAGVA